MRYTDWQNCITMIINRLDAADGFFCWLMPVLNYWLADAGVELSARGFDHHGIYALKVVFHRLNKTSNKQNNFLE